jgi:hypothetical protein
LPYLYSVIIAATATALGDATQLILIILLKLRPNSSYNV